MKDTYEVYDFSQVKLSAGKEFQCRCTTTKIGVDILYICMNGDKIIMQPIKIMSRHLTRKVKRTNATSSDNHLLK